jgi:hypothetical protein
VPDFVGRNRLEVDSADAVRTVEVENETATAVEANARSTVSGLGGRVEQTYRARNRVGN